MNPATKIDVQALRARLEQRAAALRLESQADYDKLAQARESRGVLDRKEEADVVSRATVDNAEYERDLAELAEVEAALERLAEGTFGTCVDCAEPIVAARLEVQPWASRCIACQTRHEARVRSAG